MAPPAYIGSLYAWFFADGAGWTEMGWEGGLPIIYKPIDWYLDDLSRPGVKSIYYSFDVVYWKGQSLRK